jgi:hypothetical protein
MNVLAFHTQRLTAGRQNTRLACASDYPLRQSGDGLDHMLTVIEHNEDVPAPQKGDQSLNDVFRLSRGAKRRDDGARDP